MSTVEKGRAGEDLAVVHLEENGFEIVERNYTIRGGEIDIIAKKDNSLVFVEVKSGFEGKLGSPLEWITKKKMKFLIRATQSYLFKKKITNTLIRFDVIVITNGVLRHIENAFTA